MLIFSLAACTAAPEKKTEPKATDAPILTEFEQWQERMLRLCNMEYDGFVGYWDLRCDGFYGDDLITALEILSGGAKPFLPLEERDALIESTRASYAADYGEDWRFSVKSLSSEDIPDPACEDFAAELNKIADSAAVLRSAADSWNDAGWSEFALDHNCSVADAKRLVEAYRGIESACSNADVTEALCVTVSLELDGDGTRSQTTDESFTVYLVNGHYVTESLIDYSYALINLIY